MRILLLILFSSLIRPLWSAGCSCDHTLSAEKSYFDGAAMNVQPGDKVCIPAGTRSQFRLVNFVGTAEKPITFINCGGQVTVKGNEWYAIAVNKSEFFRITGTGDTAHEYGIKIDESGTMGIQIGEYSTDFEVDHIEITNVGFAGVMAKTDPSCDNRDLRSFVQKNTVLHDLYIHDIGGEGMYLGYSWYPAREGMNCNGESVTLYSHRLEGVKIYDNILEKTGWDGIQVGCATEDVEIHHNIIKDYGTAKEQYQDNGMQIGSGTTGKVYSNYIINGKGNGTGIIVFGVGENHFYNNVIAHAASYGMYINDNYIDPSRPPYWVMNNTIVSSKQGGIRMSLNHSDDHLFYNNLIVDPSGQHIQGGEGRREQKNNLMYDQVSQAHFVDPSANDYRLQASSPAIDAGMHVEEYGILQGHAGIARPQGDQYDIGAYEFSDAEQSGGENPATDSSDVVLAIDRDVTESDVLFPNPAASIIYLNIPYEEDTQLAIVDASGRVYKTGVIARPTSQGTLQIDLSSVTLPSGLYFLRLLANPQPRFFRFYKL